MRIQKTACLVISLALSVQAFLVIGCSQRSRGADLILAGSTSIQPFVDKWAEHFMEERPGVVVNVEGGGTSAGIQACRDGTCQIGLSSRELKPEEKDLLEIVVARDGLAVIVHPSSTLDNLKIEEVNLIFSGEVRNWKYFGGPDREINVVTREEGSGTRGAFQEMVMGKTRIFKGAIVQDSNGAVREIVSNDPCAIGFISLGLVNEKVKALKLNGVMPSEKTIRDKTYKLVRPFLFLTKTAPEGKVKDFIDYVLSEKGQTMIKHDGLIPVR